jgi:LEA14-like dessication related protein
LKAIPANLRGLIVYNMAEKRNWKGVIVWACMFAASACQKPVIPEYLGFVNPKFDKINPQNSQVSVNLKFYNANHFGLKLKKAEMDISLNDKLANHYLLDSTIVIARTDTFYIPISMRLDLKSLFSNALQVFMSRQVKITLDGKVKMKRGILSFSRHFHYEVNQSIDSLIKLGN